MSYEDFQVDWPAAEHGSAKIEQATASIRDVLHGVAPGSVATALYVNRWLVMSDTRDEYRDHAHAIHRAEGRVLINGLGLGCYLKAILAKPTVDHVDVVEINEDVIALIAPHFPDPRVTFHLGDALSYTFPTGTRWDVAWHDIWPNKCEDDLKEHATLSRRYGRRVGWQGCWAHEYLLRVRRHDRAYAWR